MICLHESGAVSFDMSKNIEALEHAMDYSMAEERNRRIQQLIDAILSDNSTSLAAYEAMRAEEMEPHLNQRPFVINARSSDWQRMRRMESVQTVRQRANKQRRAHSFERLPQSDIKSISLHASQPVPPTSMMKGGYYLDCQQLFGQKG